jgi:hypothetical protein
LLGRVQSKHTQRTHEPTSFLPNRTRTGTDRQSTGGPVTQRYIIAVDTHDPDGKPYLNPKKRAREAFNLLPGRTVDDWVALAEINEEDVPKEKLQKIVLRHDGAVYLVKHD